MVDLQQCASAEAVELISLLSRFEMEGLLYAHDRIAEQSAVAAAPSDADADVEGGVPPESAFISTNSAAHPADKTFKIIRLEKSNEPLVNELFIHSFI